VIEWIKGSRVPLLGICLGLQLIGSAFGVPTVRVVEDGEFGFSMLQKEQDHPLLKGVSSSFRVMEMHRCGLLEVPEGFTLLASSSKCRVQMIVHIGRPIVAVQFHPEINTAAQQSGFQVLQEFFHLY
jgi:GMP synthase (glutamine-hydrolysing)